MLTISNLHITPPDSKNTILQVPQLKIHLKGNTCISGPSGCGKTSFLKALNGEFPYEGQIHYQDYLLHSRPVEHAPYSLVLVSQEPFVPQMTVEQFHQRFCSLAMNQYLQLKLASLLEDLEILGVSLKPHSSLKQLSGGEKLRFVIAAAAQRNPHLLLLDEPSSALNPQATQRVLQYLSNLSFPVLSTSHDPEWIKNSTQHLHIQKKQLLFADKETHK